MELLRLGKVTSPTGLKGELKVYPYTDYKEKFEELDYVLMDGEKRGIESVRYYRDMAVLKLTGVDDRAAAEACRDQILAIAREDAPPLPEGAYYVRDLLGMEVMDERGGKVGILKDVHKNAAQDLYEIQMDQGNTFLLPAVEEFVLQIDMERGVMVVRLIEGMVQV